MAGLAEFSAALHGLVHTRATEGEALALPAPDPLALADDLARAAWLIEALPEAGGTGAGAARCYLAQFLAGLARSTGDGALGRAAARLEAAEPGVVPLLRGLVARRLAATPAAFLR
ncbi:MAG: hypothetical protein ACK4M5_08960, partial [Dietzia cercidiphylli]